MERYLNAIVVLTVLVNLCILNGLLYLFHGDADVFSLLISGYNPAAFIALGAGFYYCRPEWSDRRTAATAVLVSFAIPALGTGLLGAVVSEAMFALTMQPQGYFVGGTVLGLITGWFAALVIVPVNILGLFLFRRRLRPATHPDGHSSPRT